MMPTLKIESECNGERLDVVLARAYPKYSRSFLQKVVKQGGVKLQGETPSTSYRVRAGETFDIADFETPRGAVREMDRGRVDAKPGALEQDFKVVPVVLHEDEFLLVLNKPAGLVVHPARGHRGSTLIDWLRGRLGTAITNRFLDPQRLGLVHRLDKDTSGVLLVAKSVEAQTALSRQFRDRTIRKTYSAFVEGILSAAQGVISAPVARSRKNPARMAVSNYGRPSETTFQVLEVFPATKSLAGPPGRSGGKEAAVSQLSLFPKTGRTHQIRVHMAAIGHPIIGDIAYGSKTLWGENYGVRRSLLHAEKLEFTHPATQKTVSFQAPWPQDFLKARKLFRKGLALIGVTGFLSFRTAPLKADTGTTSASTEPAAIAPVKHHSASSSSGSTASAVRALKKEVGTMKEQLDTLKAQISALQTSYEGLSASSRLSDLEHAVSELNAKAVGGATTSEETRTQIMETGRKIKDLADTLGQMRDQMDRMQHELIELRTQQEAVPAAPPATPAPAPATNGTK